MSKPKQYTFRELRKERGLTLIQLAEATGLDVKTVGKVERGQIPLYDGRFEGHEIVNRSVSIMLDHFDTKLENSNIVRK